MTADLVTRLDAEADFAHSLIAEAVGDRRTLLAEREALLREAASALRSSGEAVAWPNRMVNLPCPDGGTDRILGFRIPEGDQILGKFGLSEPLAWLRSVTVDRCPATPANAWRPIAEAPRDGRVFLVYMPEERRSIQTAWQNENGVMAIGSCFSFDLTPATHWMPLPAPPTSTKARRVCNRNCDCVGPCKAGLED